MRSPGRSRRCKGRCPSPKRHWLSSREGGEGGAPSQKTCRPPRKPIEPLAEGGFVLQARRPPRSPCGGPPRGSPAPARRQRSHTGSFRCLHGNRVAVRDRRRQTGDRRRRPVRLPEAGSAHEALRLHAERRGDRRLPARPRRHRLRPERLLGVAAQARDPRPRPGRREDADERVRTNGRARPASPAMCPQATRVVARLKKRIAGLVATARAARAA